MIVYIPIADGMIIPPEVTASLTNQTIPVDIRIRSNPRIAPGYKHDMEFINRLHNAIAMNRQSCLDDAGTPDYLCICNYDIVHLMNTNLADATAFLELNPSYGAVTMRPVVVPVMHMMDSCVVIRGSAIPAIDYYRQNRWTCSCIRIWTSLGKAGLKYGYFDDLPRIRDLDIKSGK